MVALVLSSSAVFSWIHYATQSLVGLVRHWSLHFRHLISTECLANTETTKSNFSYRSRTKFPNKLKNTNTFILLFVRFKNRVGEQYCPENGNKTVPYMSVNRKQISKHCTTFCMFDWSIDQPIKQSPFASLDFFIFVSLYLPGSHQPQAICTIVPKDSEANEFSLEQTWEW